MIKKRFSLIVLIIVALLGIASSFMPLPIVNAYGSIIIIGDGVYTGSTQGSRPLARDSTGRLWCVYTGGGYGNYWVKVGYSDDEGETWTLETIATKGLSYIQCEASIAIDSNDDVHVVWRGKGWGTSAVDDIIYMKRTSGVWGSAVELTDVGSAQEEPSIAIDSNDYVHIVWNGLGGGGVGGNAGENIYYKMWNGSWQATVIITNTGYRQEGAVIAIDSNDYIHLAWCGQGYGTYITKEQIRYCIYDGAWQAIEQVTNIDYKQWGQAIAIDSDDDVHLTWYGTGWGVNTGYDNIQYRERTGAGWQSQESITDVAYNQGRGASNYKNGISLDNGGNVYVLWCGLGWGTYTTDRNIQYRERTGAGWQSQVALTDLDTSSGEGFALLLWANYPEVGGEKINVPVSGFAGVWNGGSSPYSVKFYGSSDLVWELLPIVITSAASLVEDTTATLNGSIANLNGGGNATVRGFEYGLTTDYGSDWHETGDYGTGDFDSSDNITGLSAGTTYHFKAYATSPLGTGYGGDLTFLTKPAAPTGVSATDGTYTNKVTVTWTKSTGATGYKVYRDAVDASGWLGDVATFDDTGADAGTIDAGDADATDGDFEGYVTLSLSSEGTNDGTSHTYKVVAKNATGNSDDSGTNNGYRGVGALTYQWQRSDADSDEDYSDIEDATTEPYDDTGAPSNGNGRYYRCVLNATGAAQAISTPDRGYRDVAGYSPLVILTTATATNIEETTATTGGSITDLGTGGNATVRGVKYGLSSGAYPYDSHENGDFGLGSYTRDLVDLSEGTLYFYTAYATNGEGTGYGSEKTFMTKPLPPTGISVATTTGYVASGGVSVPSFRGAQTFLADYFLWIIGGIFVIVVVVAIGKQFGKGGNNDG